MPRSIFISGLFQRRPNLPVVPAFFTPFGTALLAAAPTYATTFTQPASGLGTTLEISAVVGTTAYGTTQYGGTADGGTLFSVTSAKKVTRLHNFVPATDGNLPNDMLAVDPGGNIYGTTQQGGTFGGGTIFAFTRDHVLKVMQAFDAATGDGATPLQGLARSATGALYGAAAGGAISTNGSVFEIQPAGNYTRRYRFKSAGAPIPAWRSIQREMSTELSSAVVSAAVVSAAIRTAPSGNCHPTTD